MAVVISAMAPSCTPSSLHGSSRLSRASSGASMPPPPSPSPAPPALAKKNAQDTFFADEEFQALMSSQCELLSFYDNDLQSPPPSSPLLSLHLQAQQLCREDDACARFQETPPPSFAMDDLEEPITGGDIERLASLFCDEEKIQAMFCDEEFEALCAAPESQQQASMPFSRPRSDDHLVAGKKRMSSSPPWPSCIEDDDEGEEAGPPPPLVLPCFPLPPKKARTQTKRRSRREHGLPPPLPPRPIMKERTQTIKKARTQTKRRGSRHEQDAAARAALLQHRLRDWRKTIVTRILTRQFRAPELSRRRTALRCQCPELALAPPLAVAGDERKPRGGLGCCALHQDALPEHRAWMFSAQGHAPPLVGGPGQVLVPTVSTGGGKAMVLQYARWRRSVSLPTRFYVERVVEKQKVLAQQQRDE